MKSFASSKNIRVVNLAAPEPKSFKEKFEKGIYFLQKNGFNVSLSENIFSDDGFFNAGLPQEQAKDLHDAIKDTNVDFIICAGGGTVANNILPFIDYGLIKKNPKPILGMSAVTGILNSISSISNITTFHGPVIIWNFGEDDGIGDYTLNSLRYLTDSNKKAHRYQPRENGNEWITLRGGNAKGILRGGNLGFLQRLIGTKYEPQWDGSILFIEDCFKAYSLISEMLLHFKNAGIFNKINGLVVGDFLESNPGNLKGIKSLDEVIMNVLSDYNFPILYNVELGHTKEKITLPIGGKATLSLNQNSKLFEVVWQ